MIETYSEAEERAKVIDNVWECEVMLHFFFSFTVFELINDHIRLAELWLMAQLHFNSFPLNFF